jgi:hypothetical protein
MDGLLTLLIVFGVIFALNKWILPKMGVGG